MESLILPFFIVSAIVCAFIANRMAGQRGRNRDLWIFLSILFSWLAILVLATIPTQTPTPAGTRRIYCPRCNAEQNVAHNAPSYECWQCHLVTDLNVKH
ncbi:hypothetical protein ACK8HH_03670 [Gordonia sp. LUNF6]|uniref:hypothetical protein n=1 Tax=Gordonia sp. LUNF6 TaxID=3388658 RepID=UPI0039997EE3